MKSISVSRLLFKGAIGALVLQAVSLATVQARPGDGDRGRPPSVVIRLDSASHNLVDSFQRSQRDERVSRSDFRFLQAAKNVEANAHTLRANVDAKRGSRRAAEDVAALRRAYSQLSEASLDVRLSERVRNDFFTVRSLVKEVEQNREYIYASANPDRRGHDHDHDHDHRDDRRDDDRRGPRLPGVLGKIFGN